MECSCLINNELIVIDLEAKDKEDAIRKIGHLIEKQGKLYDYEGFIQSVFEREKTFPTAVGYEVSIPHGKSKAVKECALAFARLKEKVIWSEDEEARYVFMIAVPESDAGDKHLKILADVSRKIMRDEFRESLKNSTTIDEIYKAIES